MDFNEDAKYLDNDEIITLELNHAEAKVNKLEIEKLELRKSLVAKDKQILELQFKLKDFESQDYTRAQELLQSQDKQRLTNHKLWIEWVEQKHELSTGWGFDPDSGEIKQD